MLQRVTVLKRESAYNKAKKTLKMVETKSLPLQFVLCSYVKRTYFWSHLYAYQGSMLFSYHLTTF